MQDTPQKKKITISHAEPRATATCHRGGCGWQKHARVTRAASDLDDRKADRGLEECRDSILKFAMEHANECGGPVSVYAYQYVYTRRSDMGMTGVTP